MCFFHKNILHSFVCFIPNKNGLSIPSIATAVLFSFIASLCFSLVAYFLTFTLHFLITFADYFTVILVVCFAYLHYHFARENVPFRGVASDSIDCVCEFLTSTVFNFVFVAHFFPYFLCFSVHYIYPLTCLFLVLWFAIWFATVLLHNICFILRVYVCVCAFLKLVLLLILLYTLLRLSVFVLLALYAIKQPFNRFSWQAWHTLIGLRCFGWDFWFII